MISTANLTIQFGAKPLFENVSIKFGEGNRYGLIGANGSGKSTFMKILGGTQHATSGIVTLAPDEMMSMLSQDQFAYEQHTAIDTVIMGHAELWKIGQERDRIYTMTEMSDEDGIRVADLEVTFSEMDGYTAESRAGELLLGAGIPLAQHFSPMSEIAPGDKLRVLLAQALFCDPEILLLDEPTNNLDINTIRWLEHTLNSRNSTMIIISHDRHFLNSVCTHMADLDYGEIRVYPGNYDDFMLASTQARQSKLANNARKQSQVKELQAFIQRFKANKSKARQATSRQKQIDKLAIEKIKPSSRVNPYIRFEVEKKLHRNVLEIEKLSASYGDEKVIDNLNLIVEAGEKVAIIGPNGIGKTTFLNALMDQGSASISGAIKWSENADQGYFEQNHADVFNENVSLFDWISRWTKPGDDEQVIRGVLGRLLFSRDDIGKSIQVISGGEQGRLLFGQLMLGRNNVMLLDEPTNHLDMESIESLNLALDLYPGTLFFVSHDREFVSSLATRIIELGPDGIVDYKGTYDEYLRSRGLN